MEEEKAMLLVRDCDGSERIYALDEKPRWTFGRESSAVHPDIPVCSEIVSRQHGVFSCADEQWFYIDQGGRNGTFYNEGRIPVSRKGKRYPVLLSSGDVLRVDYEDPAHPDGRSVWMKFFTE